MNIYYVRYTFPVLMYQIVLQHIVQIVGFTNFVGGTSKFSSDLSAEQTFL